MKLKEFLKKLKNVIFPPKAGCDCGCIHIIEMGGGCAEIEKRDKGDK